jgi:NAD(P)-dependent dehydrogenase (short-subunit alcohol dehydrogenase family)
MRGKTVVITGGTSGIGEVAAEVLAKKGARIVLVRTGQDPRRRDPRATSQTARLVSPIRYILLISHTSPR